MFRSHRSKKSAAEPEPAPSQQTSSADGATDANRSRNGLAANTRPNGPSTSPMTSSPPTVDDLDDVDLPIDSRMRRNLTVSRSGRYKSKSRPRAALDQAVGAPAVPVEGPATRSATAIPSSSTAAASAASTASTSVATYNQVIASAAGPPMPSAYRGMTTAL